MACGKKKCGKGKRKQEVINMEEIIKGFVPDKDVPVANEETIHYDGKMEEI